MILLRQWLVGAACLHLGVVAGAAEQLEEVVITASLRPAVASQLAQSATVTDAAQLAQSGVQHFADVLALTPNLAAAGGTSRPRYFQLRGVGEQEQYQGAPNPSVGFLIDGIDFSGVGMPATLFDLDAIEVLRGPQASVYGANALAGLINLRTHAPAAGFDLRAELDGGQYNTRSAGLALGDGRVADGVLQSGWRLVAQRYRSDGFRDNVFLNRTDTNGFDESTLRAKGVWQVTPGLAAQLTLMHVDLDNGYDAWSIDNTRITQSDMPGRDAQRSNGAALRLTLDGALPGSLQSLSSAADSRILFSYDGDWGNDPYWASLPACRPDPSLCVPYDYDSTTHRQRRTAAEDLRWSSDTAHRLFLDSEWLLGLYALRLTEDNDQLDHYNGAVYRQLDSRYAATNVALYGQLDVPLRERLKLTMAARVEQRRARYQDSDGNAFAPTDRMWGGNLTLGYSPADTDLLYLTLARGYRAGGFNIGTSIPAGRRQFRPEFLWNLEAGAKRRSASGAWEYSADVFYMRRLDQQVSSSVQTDPTDPLTFEFYTDNAARGENYGAEAQARWQATPRWNFAGTLGLLRTRYIDFSYEVVQDDAAGNPVIARRDLSGRAQEYAPAYQLSLSGEYRRPLAAGAEVYVHLDASRTAGYYFSASHDQRANAYGLLNARLGWQRHRWDVSLWARNLLDATYALHGFYFGNEPPDFADHLYLQNGAPRQMGVTVRFQLEEAP
jgi:iron complex outermembrane receptor protein